MFFRFKDCVPLDLVSGVDKYTSGWCNSSYYGETDRLLKVRSGEHIGISPLVVIHKCISSEIADFFSYFLNPLPPSSLTDLAKKISNVSFFNTQYEKCLNTKSSLKQIQDAHFHWSFNETDCSTIRNKLSMLGINKGQWPYSNCYA